MPAMNDRVTVCMPYMPVYPAGYVNSILADFQVQKVDRDLKYDEIVEVLKKKKVDAHLAPAPKSKG